MRADAKRNRERIIETARDVFREQGYEASLDEIAKRAGVGPGTLYRHFPNRDALMDAMLATWVERVDEATEKALAYEGDTRAALLNWFETYRALISQHKGTPAKITSAIGDPDSPISTKCQVLTVATARILDSLDAPATLKPGTDAVQIARLVGGVATVADNADLDAEAVRPLLEVLADGLIR